MKGGESFLLLSGIGLGPPARPGGPRARLAVRTHLLFTGCHTMNLLALATGALAATRAWEAPAMRRVAIATGLLLRVSWMKQGARVECG